MRRIPSCPAPDNVPPVDAYPVLMKKAGEPSDPTAGEKMVAANVGDRE